MEKKVLSVTTAASTIRRLWKHTPKSDIEKGGGLTSQEIEYMNTVAQVLELYDSFESCKTEEEFSEVANLIKTEIRMYEDK